MSKEVNFALRIIVQLDGENFFGPGKTELMEQIQQTGSISEAARTMGLSYRKALHLVEHMNRLYGQELVLTWKGGAEKGGAKLSPAGETILARYKSLRNKVADLMANEKDAFLGGL